MCPLARSCSSLRRFGAGVCCMEKKDILQRMVMEGAYDVIPALSQSSLAGLHNFRVPSRNRGSTGACLLGGVDSQPCPCASGDRTFVVENAHILFATQPRWDSAQSHKSRVGFGTSQAKSWRSLKPKNNLKPLQPKLQTPNPIHPAQPDITYSRTESSKSLYIQFCSPHQRRMQKH